MSLLLSWLILIGTVKEENAFEAFWEID
jgi:hypothetical protein